MHPTDNKETSKMRHMLSVRTRLIIAMAIFVAHGVAFSANNFVKISLPNGLSIELPRNWVVFSGNQRITLESSVQSRLDLSGIEYEDSNLPFAANYYDDHGNTQGILNIRYYPHFEFTQQDVRSMNTQDVKDLDAAIKEGILNSGEALGITVTSWIGTHKALINGITAFITEYQRKSQMASGEFRVRLVRVFSGNKSFTLIISYHESVSFLLRPIADRIINSIYLDG